MRVAVLVAEGVEDLEYWVTVMRLREAGATVTSVGMTLDTVHGKNGLEARADVLAAEVGRVRVRRARHPRRLAARQAAPLRRGHEPGPGDPRCRQADRDHLPWRLGRDLGGDHPGGPPGHGFDRDQGRSRQRGRALGRRACLPRRDARVGPCCRRHPGLRARTRRAVRGAPRRRRRTLSRPRTWAVRAFRLGQDDRAG